MPSVQYYNHFEVESLIEDCSAYDRLQAAFLTSRRCRVTGKRVYQFEFYLTAFDCLPCMKVITLPSSKVGALRILRQVESVVRTIETPVSDSDFMARKVPSAF